MAFEIGERVRFLHENQEGVVHRILGHGKVEVLIDDFYELEVSESDLVRIHPLERKLQKKEDAGSHKPSSPEPILPPALVVAVKGNDREVLLVNRGEEDLLFSFYLKRKKRYTGLRGGTCPARGRELLHRDTEVGLSQLRALRIQVLPVRRGEDVRPGNLLDLEVPVNELEAESRIQLPGLDTPGWNFPLSHRESPVAPVPPPESPAAEIVEVPNVKPSPKEAQIVDLHIDHIVENPMGLSSDAMLRLQVEAFERSLTDAVMDNQEELIFIHGIGNGALKREIHARLARENYVREFHLADPLKYGNGATRVLINT